MSFDTGKNYVYSHHGKTLRLWRFRRTPAKDVDTEGRTTTSGWHSFIYPDETIDSGLRIEYTAIEKPFVAAASAVVFTLVICVCALLLKVLIY